MPAERVTHSNTHQIYSKPKNGKIWELTCFTARRPGWQNKRQITNLNKIRKLLISERSLEDLGFELASQDLSSLVLGKGLDKHDPGPQLLVRGDSLCHPVDDGLLHHVSVLPDDVSSGKLAGSLVGNSDNGDVVNSGMASDQIFEFRRSDLKLIFFN